MYALFRRFLFLLPAEAAHHCVMWLLSLGEAAVFLCQAFRRRALRETPDLRTMVCGLEFPNPVGLAAGLDKNAEAMVGLFATGFGFIEVGTLTPRPQPGNPQPRLFRLPAHEALINRMGFNNEGAAAAASRIRELTWRPGPLGINLGKNKDTPLSHAVDDYVQGVKTLAPLADYLVINASSPNTPNLRQLQEPEALDALLLGVRQKLDEVAPKKPLFLKISPDLGAEAIDTLVDVALKRGIDGLIATNTTLTRPVSDAMCVESGGLSGKPLRNLSTEVIRRAYRRSQGRLPIIGVGGIFSADDVYEKIRAGASLVQVYTGFVYKGPSLVRRILLDLGERLKADGFSSVSEAVGTSSANSETT